MSLMELITTHLRRVITQPVGELTRAQRALRFWADLSRHCARELGRNQATQMAAALTYRTIFSLIPIAVLMLLVFRAFGGFEQASVSMQERVYQYLGLASISLPAQSGGPSVAAGGTAQSTDETADPQTQQQLKDSIAQIMTDLTSKASQASVGSVGAVGLLVLIWAALAQLITVENCFNQVYNCPTGRSWHLRVPIYWAVLTLGPVLLFVSLYVVEAGLAGAQHWVEAGGMPLVLLEAVGWLGRLAALGATWLLLFLLYVLMPNGRVRLRPALAGSLVAAVLWETGKWGFKLYVSRAVSYSAIYGTLGLVPLFLLWLYVTWIIVLFGLEITYTLQAMRGRVFEKAAQRAEQRCVYDPRWVLPIMARIAGSFKHAQPVGPEELAADLGLPVRGVIELGQKLQAEGMIHSLQSNDEQETRYTLARPAEDITIQQMLDTGRTVSLNGAGKAGSQAWASVAWLDDAQRQAAGDQTLAQLLETLSR